MRHLLTGIAVSMGVAMAGGGAFAQAVGIATSNPGSLYHNMGTAVAGVANDAGLNTTIQPATSPNQYMPLVGQGGIEFGIGNLEELNHAYNGSAWFGDIGASPDLRMATIFHPLQLAIFVRKDSDIKSIADLKGKRVTDGFTAQNTILPQLSAIYATVGMTRDDIVPVNVASVVSGAEAFMAGEADAFIFAHGAGKVREADAAVGIRALPVDDPSPEALERTREHWKTGFFIEKKAGSSPGVLEDGTYFAYPQVLFTNATVSDDAVYQMVKALHGGKEKLAGTFRPFVAFNPANMKGDSGDVPYHPGALRFYEEAGVK